MAAERLQLLLSIQPLLNPSLPSPPPSPRLGQAELPPLAGPSHGRKRDSTVGLGLSDTAVPEPAELKRVRHSPPKAAIPQTPDFKATPRLKPFMESPLLQSPALGAAGGGKRGEDWRDKFPRERLRHIATAYREQGRGLKHSGDRVARESQKAKDHTLAVVLQMEAILLYIFAFWADDQANKTCLATNWQSIFGLLTYVRRAAEKQGLAVVLGLCLRMEALACQVLSTHEQKSLNYKGVQFAAAAVGPSPSGGGPPPHAMSQSTNSNSNAPPDASPSGSHHTISSGGSPSANGAHPPPATDLVKHFTSASSSLFRIHRLLADSASILSPALMATYLPRTWHAATVENVDVDGTGVVVPTKSADGTWKFAWPVEVASPTAVPHWVAWARSCLEEWAEGEQCGYRVTKVKED